MKIALISFTKNGSKICKLVSNQLNGQGNMCIAYGTKDMAKENGLVPVIKSISKWTKDAFDNNDAIVFVGATGIAVRAIAPYIKSKAEDPAIVVIDEKGQYVISLLSGHLGGANNLANTIAENIEAIPIITTATDINEKFAVDLWAKSQELTINTLKAAKQVSVDILQGKTIYVYSEYNLEGNIPKELKIVDAVTLKDRIREGETCIIITEKILDSLKGKQGKVLQLIPKSISVGLGCRKGISLKAVEEIFKQALTKADINVESVRNLASIDLKQEEKALQKLSAKLQVPFHTYSGEELMTAEGEFTESSFVRSITGVENVCERAAVVSSDNGKLILPKEALNGVTVAIAKKDITLYFAESDFNI